MARFVLVHGAFCGAWVWGPLIERLTAKDHSVEAFDLPGLGEDHTPVSEITLDACADRLCDVLSSHPSRPSSSATAWEESLPHTERHAVQSGLQHSYI